VIIIHGQQNTKFIKYLLDFLINIIYCNIKYRCEPVSSVGIAIGYGLDGLGIETMWGRDFFAHVKTGPGAHPASCTMGTRSFPGVKRPGLGADHPPPRPLVACYRVIFTFTFIKYRYKRV
jgi:hypothetical protein